MQWVSGNEFIWDAEGLDEELYFWGGKTHRAAEAQVREFSERYIKVAGYSSRVDNRERMKGDLTAAPTLVRRTRLQARLSDSELTNYATNIQDVDFLFGEDDVDEGPDEPTVPLMPEDEFWALIDVLEGSVADVALSRLEFHLRQLPVDTIKQFAERFAERLWQLDQQAIYKRYKLGGILGLGGDGFLYYRATALADGRAAFERYVARTERFTGGVNDIMDGEMLLGVADDAIRYTQRDLEHYDTRYSFETGSNEAQWPKITADRRFDSVFFVRIVANGVNGPETFLYGYEAPRANALALAATARSSFDADFSDYRVCAEQLFLGLTSEWSDSVRAFSIRYSEKPALGELPASRIPETVIAG